MSVRPVVLNAVIAWLFVIGSACFAVGALPAYAQAVGAPADSVTFFVGSVFFTAASFAQLLQAQTPAMTDVDAAGQHARRPLGPWVGRPRDPGWLAAVTQLPGTVFFNVSTFAALSAVVADEDQRVWRPDVYGSTLFLVSSAFGVLAVSRRVLGAPPPPVPLGIAWLNMAGSVLFMASAIASYVDPSTQQALDSRLSGTGTLLGALCFLVGAALLFPAWRSALRRREPSRAADGARARRPRDA